MYILSPVGLAAAPVANQLALLATFKEKLCRPFCVNSTVQPQVSVSYEIGTPTLNETTVFAPVTAIITVVTPGCGCRAATQLFTERFEIAFQGQTALPASITVENVGRVVEGSCVVCGRAKSISVNDSLTFVLTTA